jgi:hypothetical protein
MRASIAGAICLREPTYHLECSGWLVYSGNVRVPQRARWAVDVYSLGSVIGVGV